MIYGASCSKQREKEKKPMSRSRGSGNDKVRWEEFDTPVSRYDYSSSLVTVGGETMTHEQYMNWREHQRERERKEHPYRGFGFD